jgi:iron(II)-dependent oxidoreductase
MHEQLAAGLERARERTLGLTGFDDAELTRQHSPLMSPLVWDLAHVGQQEDLWLLRLGDGRREPVLPAAVDRLYDAFLHPRSERPSLPLLSPARSRGFLSEVRGRVLDGLGRAVDLFPYAMVEQHEQQHDETMLATHQLRSGPPLLGPGTALPAGDDSDGRPGAAVLVPAGPCVVGVDAATEPWSLDNERPAHVVDIPAFRIGRVPVTNRQWQAFMDDGGYAQPHWWSARGWRHRVDAGLERPLFWAADGSRTRFGVVEDVPPDEPVQHVCSFEAEAFAAWAGGRLPTELEWEKACAWDPVTGRRRRWPWGDAPPTRDRANLGGDALRPAPAGAYPTGRSAYGVEQMIGDVWEWTSSALRPWPGFTPMLYATYSAPFFGGDFRVLRGGSWAAAPSVVRPSFRNWDLPVRRQIFAGVRLAWDP